MEYLILTTYEHEATEETDSTTYSYSADTMSASFPDGVLIRAKKEWKNPDVCQVEVFKIADKWDVKRADEEPKSELELLRAENERLRKKEAVADGFMDVVKDITGTDPRKVPPTPTRDSRSLTVIPSKASELDIAANLLRETIRTKGKRDEEEI